MRFRSRWGAHTKRKGLRWVAGAIVLLSLLVGVGAASANFKGNNGLIAFDSWTGTSQDIGVFDPSGGAPTMLTSTADFYEQTPRWSRDGMRIVYMGHPQYVGTRTVTDIWVMDADGANKTQLTNTPRREEVPAWTDDGRIVYCGQSADNLSNWEIYVMNADGTGVTNLTNSPAFDCWPSPAPSGKKLAFTSTRDGEIAIFTMKLDGTGVRRVTDGFASDWSPSGNDLVFMRDDENGIGDVWAAHSDGSELRRLTDTPETEAFPSFAPDGGRVVFGRIISSGPFNIFAIDLSSGEENLLLADSPPTTYSVAYPAWQPLPRERDEDEQD